MKAFIKSIYGGPEVLHLEEVPKPELKNNHILVKINANSANPADWHILRGKSFLARLTTGLFKPKEKILGADFSGIVEEVGEEVSHFKVGDQIFGGSLEGGAFAEYMCVPAKSCGLIPKGLSFAEMACVPIAGLTAFQALVTHGQLKAGESVIINGSSGGVGHFAVQIAKAHGAKVTAICSSKSIDFVKSLGADKVIAYDQGDVQQLRGKHDLVLDLHGNLNYSDFKRLGNKGIIVGFTSMGHMVGVLLKTAIGKFKISQFTVQSNTTDLESLAALIKSGKINAFIEKTYPFTEIPDAISYIEKMRTKGKVAMLWTN